MSIIGELLYMCIISCFVLYYDLRMLQQQAGAGSTSFPNTPNFLIHSINCNVCHSKHDTEVVPLF